MNLTFPPLMSGEAVADPFAAAQVRAIQGCDAGLVTYDLAPNRLQAALVFAPEIPLRQAMIMVPLCGIGFQNALGALAPPEVAVHLDWAGQIRINGAVCGGLRVASGGDDPAQVPDWLVVGLSLPLWPEDDVHDPGATPDQTTLYAEGCADVAADRLLESWTRHTLSWIRRWEDDGPKPVHAEWRGLAHGLGENRQQNGRSGTFLGIDEEFGMLLRDTETTHLIPLTSLLDQP